MATDRYQSDTRTPGDARSHVRRRAQPGVAHLLRTVWRSFSSTGLCTALVNAGRGTIPALVRYSERADICVRDCDARSVNAGKRRLLAHHRQDLSPTCQITYVIGATRAGGHAPSGDHSASAATSTAPPSRPNGAEEWGLVGVRPHWISESPMPYAERRRAGRTPSQLGGAPIGRA